jgi:hypothetical protein
MTFPDQAVTSIARLAAFLRRLSDRLDSLEKRGTRIPVLDVDPPAGEYGNIWLFNNGRLHVRDADGVVHEFVPSVDYRPVLPTFASDPAVSTGWRMWLVGGTGALRARLSNDTVKTFSADAAGGASDGGTPPPPPTTSPTPKPPVVRRVTHVSTFAADDSACYCPIHGVENTLYYGQWSSTHGERRCMFGFDATAIRAALTSQAEILKVEIIATNLHSNLNSGVDVRWGAHNVDTLGASWAQTYAGVWIGHWPKVGGRTWRNMGQAGKWLGYQFRDGNVRGLTIDQPSPSSIYYGQMRGDIQLRFTYSNTTP